MAKKAPATKKQQAKPASSSSSSDDSSSDESVKKAPVAAKKVVAKKEESSDDSSSDDSSDDEKKPAPVKKAPAAKPAAKKAESSDDSSDDSSDEEPAKKPVAKKAAPPAKKVAAKKEESSSDSSSDDSDEEMEEAPPAKKVAPPAKKVAAKKEESSSDSSSDDSDEEMEEAPPAKKAAPAAKKPVAKKEESSDDSSSDDSSDEEVAKKPVAAKKVVKKEDSTSDDSSSDDSSNEEEAPVMNKKRKNSDAEKPAAKLQKQTNGAAAATNGDAPASTEVFIAGLPWAATEDEVREKFAECGEITKVHLPQQNGRASGNAFITFDTVAAAEAALAMDGGDFNGRWMKIRTAEKKQNFEEKPEGCTSVFIGNLSWDVDEDTIRQTFAECGEILSCRLATDRETGEFRGFGHLDFDTTEAVDAAVQLAGSYVNGRAIRVTYAKNREQFGGGGGGRGGFGGRGGGRGGRGGRGDGPPKRQATTIQNFQGKKISFD